MSHRRAASFAVASLAVAVLACSGVARSDKPAASSVALAKLDDRVKVTIGGEPFTEYLFKGRAKPILYPVIGPTGVPMTRRYPIDDAGPGEEKDHPHHESLWFTHGDVNGVDFWAVGEGKGTIVTDSVEVDGDAIRNANKWIGPDGKTVLSDERVVRFGVAPADADARFIDLSITLKATAGDVTFGDTKEGSMGIRSHPALRLKGKVATGKSLNSEGVTGAAMWGKRAKWVAYWGTADDKPVGFAILDHPTNPRHPTWWHARDYGLVAANPFGVHDFEKKAKGAGDLKIANGDSLTLRYRFVFYAGEATADRINALYDAFAP